MPIQLRLAGGRPLGYTLTSGGADVGWLRAGLIGFCGFTGRAEARRAGAVAASVLAEWYRLRWHSAPLAWRGAVAPEDRIEAGGAVVGRLVAPAEVPPADAGSHGFELVLPQETWIALMVEVARRIYAALAAAGLTARAVEREGGVSA